MRKLATTVENKSAIEKGTRLFICCRHYDDGAYHIDIVTVAEVKQTFTPKGKPRKPVYLLHAENFAHGEHNDIDYETGDIDWYSKFAVDAVRLAFRDLFNMHRQSRTPEERLLNAIFGDEPNIRFAASEIPSVIADLKDFHRLFGEAFKLDEETVQNL